MAAGPSHAARRSGSFRPHFRHPCGSCQQLPRVRRRSFWGSPRLQALRTPQRLGRLSRSEGGPRRFDLDLGNVDE